MVVVVCDGGKTAIWGTGDRAWRCARIRNCHPLLGKQSNDIQSIHESNKEMAEVNVESATSGDVEAKVIGLVAV